MAEDMGKPLDWDTDEMEDSGGFTLLDEGVYPFEVLRIDKERFEGSAKIAPCPRAAVVLNVLSPTGWVQLTDRMLLSTKTQWRIARFFEGLGYEKDPATNRVPIRWNEAVGKQGFVRVKVREYEYNGETRRTNDVESYLKPSAFAEAEREIAARQQAAAAQTAIPMPQQPAQQPQTHQSWSM